jgi:hypothetical protein
MTHAVTQVLASAVLSAWGTAACMEAACWDTVSPVLLLV